MDWFLSAVLVLALDQATKMLVLRRSERMQAASSQIAGEPARRSGWRPRIHVLRNPGPRRRLGRSRRALTILWAIAVLGTIGLMSRYQPLQGIVPHVGLGAALGGATANLVDMLRHGAVIDFIDLRVWPVFNLADVAIVTGLCISIWAIALHSAG